MERRKSCKLLYELALSSFVRAQVNTNIANLDRMNNIKLLPPYILIDIYSKMAEDTNLQSILMEELSEIDLFCKLIKYPSIRASMLKCFKLLMTNNKPLASELQKMFVLRTTYLLKDQIRLDNNEKLIENMDDMEIDEKKDRPTNKQYLNINVSRNFSQEIDKGLRLGTFLYESGWLDDSLKVLNATKLLIVELDEEYKNLLLLLSCLQKLLHVQALFCCYKEAGTTSSQALHIIDKLKHLNSNQHDRSSVAVPLSLLANLYHELSVLHFYRSEYDLSFNWSVKALKYLREDTPHRITVDVLRQAAKSCVVKRKFQNANLLINSAVKIAESSFGKYHSKYADALLDKAFFLLNVDSINKSVDVYMEALAIKCSIFGEKNLNVAVIHEDLAYALYVYEYSRGRFNMARFYVEKAIEIMSALAPLNHIMLASAKRVKALILEEIALDNMVTPNSTDYKGLLKESEELHHSALQLSLDAFGEINVQTAKHYGNLGRLYQSMLKFGGAEEMHQRAIKIKRDLLGDFDYEVGLSIGHLASLYNYHMKKYQEAEELYLKSIHISLRLFGQTYSGLEYDYRGLLHVYEELQDHEKYMQFSDILEEWRILRIENDETRKPMYVEANDDASIEEVTKKFFDMHRCD